MPRLALPTIASVDTETTGVDIRHGCKPFMVTGCVAGDTLCATWDVNPITRQPVYDDNFLADWRTLYANLFTATDLLVLHNPKFDYRALQSMPVNFYWNWQTIRDTLFASHLLDSKSAHDLTALALHYLGLDIYPLEMKLKEAVTKARGLVSRNQTKYKGWRIADEEANYPEMPSAKTMKSKEGLWKWDMWLPRCIAKLESYKSGSPFYHWWTVCEEYAKKDAEVTFALWQVFEKQLREQSLEAIYNERLKLLPVIYDMESNGITYHDGRLFELYKEYTEEAERCNKVCLNLAKGSPIPLKELPKAGASNALKSVLFDHFKLPVVKTTDKGHPSTDKDALETWQLTLPEKSKARAFVANLANKRKRDTAAGYMESYRRAALPYVSTLGECLRLEQPDLEKYCVLYPSLNPTGSKTLRFSSSNPNEQNISKKEGFNLRYIFGPAPGREWWSIDYSNLELRLPAYEAGEQAMINLFEHPDDPPYYGSYHLLVSHILHPKLFDQCLKDGVSFKDRYKSTWYQYVKNGNFAVQYGAVDLSYKGEIGTADKAYHLEGAQSKIDSKFTNIKALSTRTIEFAEKHGYVETMPDRELGGRGYPLQCGRNKWGRVLKTIPLSYHIQGTAMWVMTKAMVRCDKYLKSISDFSSPQKSYFMVMQIHDELVFDFPLVPNQGNLPKVRKVCRLMRQSGDDIGIPLDVSVEYHPNHWSEGFKVAA